MLLISIFEEIVAWQEARKLVRMVYLLTNQGGYVKDYGLRDQIRRAAVSAMSNSAEGFDCESSKEFARFLGMARRSAVEVQSLLYAPLDAGYLTAIQFREHYSQARKTQALIGGFKHSLKTRAPKSTPTST